MVFAIDGHGPDREHPHHKRAGAPGEWVLVLHGTRDGFADLGTSALSDATGARASMGADGGIAFKDLDRDGRLEILLYDRVPLPDGGLDGVKLGRVYHWNGSRYIT